MKNKIMKVHAKMLTVLNSDSGVTLAQGAPEPKFVRAPRPSAKGARTERRRRKTSNGV